MLRVQERNQDINPQAKKIPAAKTFTAIRASKDGPDPRCKNTAYLGRGLEFNFPLAGPVLFYPLSGGGGIRTERRGGEKRAPAEKKKEG